MLTFRRLATHRVKFALSCRECRVLHAYGVGAHADDAYADKDLVAAWNAGSIRCKAHRRPADFMVFNWDNPMGSRDVQLAEWRLGEIVAAFPLPDPQARPARP